MAAQQVPSSATTPPASHPVGFATSAQLDVSGSGSRQPARSQRRPIVITGGSAGIGKGIAARMLAEGYPVAIIGRDAARLEIALTELQAKFESADLIAVAADVVSQEQIESAVDAVLQRWGTIGGVVAAAGRLARGSLLSLPLDELEAVWRTNVWGTWLTLRACVPAMLEDGFGRIVTIGSVLGTVGIAERAGYAATKGAVAALTRSLAVELAGTGVCVNCIAPGPVMVERMETQAAPQFDSGILQGRWGTPQDIAHVAANLLADEAEWMTGSVIHMDGGYTAH